MAVAFQKCWISLVIITIKHYGLLMQCLLVKYVCLNCIPKLPMSCVSGSGSAMASLRLWSSSAETTHTDSMLVNSRSTSTTCEKTHQNPFKINSFKSNKLFFIEVAKLYTLIDLLHFLLQIWENISLRKYGCGTVNMPGLLLKEAEPRLCRAPVPSDSLPLS